MKAITKRHGINSPDYSLLHYWLTEILPFFEIGTVFKMSDTTSLCPRYAHKLSRYEKGDLGKDFYKTHREYGVAVYDDRKATNLYVKVKHIEEFPECLV